MERFVREYFRVKITSEFLESFIVFLDFLDNDLISVVTSGSQVNLSKSPLLSKIVKNWVKCIAYLCNIVTNDGEVEVDLLAVVFNLFFIIIVVVFS